MHDIAWTEDSKRLLISGEGSDTFARAIIWDSGSSCGQITGHGKTINAVDVKQTRPFRVVTAGEDNESGFYAGPPFKLDHMNKEANKYVNCVKFSPNGETYVTADSGGKAFVYDGKEGKFMHELNGGEASAHNAGIYGLSWNADGSKMITCSADKTVKMWDVVGNALITTFTFPDLLDWQQVGCLWQGEHIISVSLNGFINFLDESNPGTPKRSIPGHATNITSLSVDSAAGVFYTGAVDGRVCKTTMATGAVELLTGHTNAVVDITNDGETLSTASLDDTVRVTASNASGALGDASKCESAPRALGQGGGGLVVVASVGHVAVMRAGKQIFATAAGYEPMSVAINPAESEVAVGGKDKKVYIYSLSGDTLTQTKTLDASGEVLCVGYSPDGQFLASGDSNRNVFVFETTSWEKKADRWKFHNSKVTCLAWAPDSQHIATGSLDTNVIIWDMSNMTKRITIAGAHPTAMVSKVAWSAGNILVSAGFDAAVRTWDITFH